MIHCVIALVSVEKSFHITFLCAFNDIQQREGAWKDLKDLALYINDPWVVAGDFNNIMYLEERIGKMVIMH